MSLKFWIIVILCVANAYSLDHLFQIRTGFGASTLMSYSFHAEGAQSIYGDGPLWGTEVAISSNHTQKDMLLWDDITGNYTDSESYSLSWIQNILVERQRDIQNIYSDLIGFDIKWVQSVLPVGTLDSRQAYLSFGSIGVSYVF
jgi:hypothetical protein